MLLTLHMDATSHDSHGHHMCKYTWNNKFISSTSTKGPISPLPVRAACYYPKKDAPVNTAADGFADTGRLSASASCCSAENPVGAPCPRLVRRRGGDGFADAGRLSTSASCCSAENPVGPANKPAATLQIIVLQANRLWSQTWPRVGTLIGNHELELC